MKTKRAFLIEPCKFDIREVDISPQPDQVLVRIEVCGLCNWELNHWKGLLGECPQTLGHEWAGTVIEIGKEVEKFQVEDKITALPESLTGFSEYTVEDAKNCIKLAPGVNVQHALGEPLKCIVTVLRGATPEAGDNGVVLGCGPMGLWCIQALSGNYLSSLIAIDVNENKLKLAKKYGATHVINPREVEVSKEIEKITGGLLADFVIEGTGNPIIFDTAISYLRTSGRGRLVLMSSNETSCKEIDFREAIKKSIEIRVTHPAYSLNQLDDLRRAVSYLNNGIFKLNEMITHKFDLENIENAFLTLNSKSKEYIKGVVIP